MTLSVQDASLEQIELRAVSIWQTVECQAALVRYRMLKRFESSLDQIDTELSNLRASMGWLRKQKDDDSALLLLSYLQLMIPYFKVRNRDYELEHWCVAGLEASERVNQNPARLLLSRGEAQYALGNWDEAENSWRSSAAASQVQDIATYAQATFALGRLQINQGNFKVALSTMAQAEKLFDKIGDQAKVLEVQSEVAAYHLNRRNLDRALELYLEIDRNYRKNVSNESSDHSLLMLGVVYRQKKSYQQAIFYLSELYRRGTKLNHLSVVATSAHHLAWTYLALGNTDEARRLCGQAIALYEEIQDPRGLSDSWEQIGAILLKQGRPKEALPYIKQSAEMRRFLGNYPGLVSSLRQEAFAFIMDGDYIRGLFLITKILFQYLRLGLLSRERIIAISKEFLVHLSTALTKKVAI